MKHFGTKSKTVPPKLHLAGSESSNEQSTGKLTGQLSDTHLSPRSETETTPREFTYSSPSPRKEPKERTKKLFPSESVSRSSRREISPSPSRSSKSLLLQPKRKVDRDTSSSPRLASSDFSHSTDHIKRPTSEFRASSAQKEPYAPQTNMRKHATLPKRATGDESSSLGPKYTLPKDDLRSTEESSGVGPRSMLSPRGVTDFAFVTRENLTYSPVKIQATTKQNPPTAETVQTTEDMIQLQAKGIVISGPPNGKKSIKAGKIDRIVSQLLDWLVSDPNRGEIHKVVHSLILTHTLFFTTEYLLSIVLSHYWDHENLRPNVLLFLSSWFEIQFLDFNTTIAKQMLEEFIQKVPRDHRKLLAAKIACAMRPLPPPTVFLFDDSSLPSESKVLLQPGRFGFMDLPLDLIAEQWTILDIKNFLEISRSEFFDTKSPRPTWNRMLQRSILLSQWVTSEIVQTVDLGERVKILSRFTKLALKFLEIGNFNGLMCVWGGLNTGPLNRLTRTKRKLPQKTIELWKALEYRLSERDDFGQLRVLAQKQMVKREPLVPWFELIDKHRNYTDQYDDIIKIPKDQNLYLNWNKIQSLGEQLLSLEGFQKLLSTVELDIYFKDEKNQQLMASVQNYLCHLPTFSEEILWKFSTQCEPEKANQSVSSRREDKY